MVYKGGPPVESQYKRYYGSLEINTPTLTLESEDNIIIVVVIKVNSIFYNLDNRTKTEDLIKIIIAKTKEKEDINILDKEIIASLKIRLQEKHELFYNTTRVKLN